MNRNQEEGQEAGRKTRTNLRASDQASERQKLGPAWDPSQGGQAGS